MVSVPPHGMNRYRASVSYDGGPFHGFAENPDVETVAGKLRQSLEKIIGHEIHLTCAGRTDAGVHAEGQIISFDAETFDISKIERSLNKLCAPFITVSDLQRLMTSLAQDFQLRIGHTDIKFLMTSIQSFLPSVYLACSDAIGS